MSADNHEPLVLIVEDDREIRRFLKMSLPDAGHRVIEAQTFKDGLIAAGTLRPDLIILDLGLPDGDGQDFIVDVRSWSEVPIIVLSARSGESDKVTALDAGADDYLTKPFSVSELQARVRACLRRAMIATPDENPVVELGDISIDLRLRSLTRNGDTVHLTPIEFRLLTLLLKNRGKILTHRQLLREVWGGNFVEHTHYLRVYMGHLRHKIEADPSRPRFLLTETGVGYRLNLHPTE